MAVNLRAEEWAKVAQDMGRVEMLTEEEIEAIATEINEHFGLPFVSEKREQVVIVKVVRKIDRFLYSVLPNEYYELIRMLDDGISDDEADIIKQRLGTLINKHVNLPIIGENTEQEIFEFVIGLIVDAMKAGHKLLQD